MGINGLLPRILPSAGRENYDLCALSDGLISISSPHHHNNNGRRDDETTNNDSSGEPAAKRRRCWKRRKVRIAVDVNGWIARAAHGHGGSLVDERHLSYQGRAELRHEQQQQQEQQEQQQQQQQEPRFSILPSALYTPTRMEYKSKCIKSVLEKIEFMREECCALVLPVLDGATPPCKRDAVRERSDRRGRATEQRDEVAVQSPLALSPAAKRRAGNEAARTLAEVLRRISASKRAGTGKDYSLRREILGDLLREFRRRGWPFLVAPYEADGQLAYLASTGAVDLVVTEDSDLIATGIPSLIYKLGGWNGFNAANRARGSGRGPTAGYLGTLLHRHDLGSSHGINLLDFSDAMLVTMFVASGCDYCNSLKGIGPVSARNIVKRAFHGGEADEKVDDLHLTCEVPVLKVILNELFRSCHKDAREKVFPLDDPDTEEVRLAYEEKFLGAIAMFRHPLVYDPISGMHVVANDICHDSDVITPASASFLRDERILLKYEPYRDLVTERVHLYQVIGAPFASETAKGIAEGFIDPRQLQVSETSDNCDGAPPERNGTTLGEKTHPREKEGRAQPGNHAEGSSGQQHSSQDFSGVGTQQSKSSSAASGMISSLSPDLLASPSPQKNSNTC